MNNAKGDRNMKRTITIGLLTGVLLIALIFTGCSSADDGKFEEAQEAYLNALFSVDINNPDACLQKIEETWTRARNEYEDDAVYYEFWYYMNKLTVVSPCISDETLASGLTEIEKKAEKLDAFATEDDLASVTAEIKSALGQYDRSFELGELSYMTGMICYIEQDFAQAKVMFQYAGSYKDSKTKMTDSEFLDELRVAMQGGEWNEIKEVWERTGVSTEAKSFATDALYLGAKEFYTEWKSTNEIGTWHYKFEDAIEWLCLLGDYKDCRNMLSEMANKYLVEWEDDPIHQSTDYLVQGYTLFVENGMSDIAVKHIISYIEQEEYDAELSAIFINFVMTLGESFDADVAASLQEGLYTHMKEFYQSKDSISAYYWAIMLGDYKDALNYVMELEPIVYKLELKNAQVGDVVRLGVNGEYYINWIVADKYGDEALLISAESIADGSIHTKREFVSWANCELRTWLNNDFYDTVFSDEDKSWIITTTVSPAYVGDYDTDPAGGVSVEDKVFILSVEEYQNCESKNGIKLNINAQEFWTRSNHSFKSIGYNPDDTFFHGIWRNGDGTYSETVCGATGTNGICPALWIDLSAIQ